MEINQCIKIEHRQCWSNLDVFFGFLYKTQYLPMFFWKKCSLMENLLKEKALILLENEKLVNYLVGCPNWANYSHCYFISVKEKFTATTGKRVKSSPFPRSDWLTLKTIGWAFPRKLHEKLCVVGYRTKMKGIWVWFHLEDLLWIYRFWVKLSLTPHLANFLVDWLVFCFPTGGMHH